MNELTDYVKKYLAQGYSIDQIKQTLVKGGHSPREVETAINQAKAQQVPPKPAPLKQPATSTKATPATPPPAGQPTSSTAPPKPTTQSKGYAGFGIRLGAFVVDYIIFLSFILGGYFGSMMLATVIGSGPGAAIALTVIIPILIWVILILTFSYLEGVYGWSPAKYILGLKVVNEHNVPPGFIAGLLRNILKWVFIPVALWILFSEKKQGLHDLAARTFVIVT